MSLTGLKKKYIDGRLILLLAAFYTLYYVIFIIKTAYMRAYVYNDIKYSLWHLIVNGYFIDWVVVVAYMTFIAVSTKRLIIRKVPWKKIFFLHLTLSIFIGVIIRLLISLISILKGEMSFNEFDVRENINGFMYVLDLNFLIYFAMIFIIYVYYYVGQVREAEEKRGLLEAQLLNTRMKMLTSQLQPHFLFNTLNSISSLVEIDAKAAQNTIADLSDFLREILYNSDAKFIPIEKELTVLEYYLNLVKIRFSDHLEIEKQVDPALLKVKIPAMILQPLVENSIKHGYSYNHTHLKIIISIQRQGDFIIVKVENNGKLMTESLEGLLKKGVGLSNLNERLINLYGETDYFEMKNKLDGTGVITIIKIPIKN
ncbi:histidine kinase [Gillisia sp. M10.2A]|uniref:Histidine kinase n=1 Tax=Gillisia lutea TaxID=2909668 RepID=A0ABS9EHU0_9FLAO|nr:histidine kinase [Gillisia lutea]MCF4101414.1 histidine kinase [Gillisia lutea]